MTFVSNAELTKRNIDDFDFVKDVMIKKEKKDLTEKQLRKNHKKSGIKRQSIQQHTWNIKIKKL